MAVDQARQQRLAPPVINLCLRVTIHELVGIANRGDVVVLDRQGNVSERSAIRIVGDDRRVGEDRHGKVSRRGLRKHFGLCQQARTRGDARANQQPATPGHFRPVFFYGIGFGIAVLIGHDGQSSLSGVGSNQP